MYQTGESVNSYFDLKYKYTPARVINWQNYSWLSEPYSTGAAEGDTTGLLQSSPSTDLLETNQIAEIMNDRKELLRSKIEMIVSGIGERKRIKQDNIYKIDKDSCELNNIIFKMPYYRRFFFGRERLMVERMKMDLESQKRMEEVSYFRDLSLLHKDLKDTIIEYMSEQNKQKLLSNLEETKCM